MSANDWARVASDAFTAAIFAYLAAMLASFYFLAFRRAAAYRAGNVVAWFGLAAHVLAIVSRGYAAGRLPWGNLYEFSSIVAALVVAAELVVVEAVYRVRAVAGFVLGFVVLSMAGAALFLYVGPAPLVPALNSYWRSIHVTAIMLASALLLLGSILTILFLVQDRSERGRASREQPPGPSLDDRSPAPIAGGSIDAPPLRADDPPDFVAGADEPVGAPSPSRGVLPPAATLDRLAYRTIALAFPIWTFAVIAGAIWAQEAWGRYWGWDPKETWAFITWVVFAGYLHARATAGWRGRRAAWIALAGFASLLVNFYVVNTFVVSLHTYAR
jgi:cytochrome c-type biogenesis protein CcsB